MTLLALTVSAARGDVVGQTVVAARGVRAHAVLVAEDLALSPTSPSVEAVGGLADPAAAIGRETAVTLFPGQPVLARNLVAPALVERNAPVLLLIRRGALTITAEGRALARGGVGDRVRALNTRSRTTVTGVVGADGTILLEP